MKIMKKIFKSRILLVIVTVILTGSISVYAAGRYYANQVEYEPSNPNFNVDNMADALDALYTNIKPEYTGAIEVTPSQSSQTLNTKDKALTKNITINPIPNTYKNLTTQTNATASDILSGKTAYTSDGTLVTGNISTNCISGSHVWTQNDANNGFKLTDYAPSYFAVSAYLSKASVGFIWYYNKNINANEFYSISSSTDATLSTVPLSSNSSFGINNNLVLRWSSNWVGETLYYMVCK